MTQKREISAKIQRVADIYVVFSVFSGVKSFMGFRGILTIMQVSSYIRRPENPGPMSP